MTFCSEAVNTVVYTINRTGNTDREGKTPYKLWFNKTPNMNHLKMIGSEDNAHVRKEKRRKWNQKSKTTDVIEEVLKLAHRAGMALDVRNAFNSAPWNLIDKALQRSSVPTYLIKIIRSYMSHRKLLITNC